MSAAAIMRRIIHDLQSETKHCLDPHVRLPWSVDLIGLTREEMGDGAFEEALDDIRQWRDESCRGRYAVHPLRDEDGLVGRRFEFEDQTDAGKFKVSFG